MARKTFSAAKRGVRQVHAAELGLFEQPSRDLFRRAAAAGREAGRLHRLLDAARQARADAATASSARLGRAAASAAGRARSASADANRSGAPKARASRFCQPRGRPSAASTASNTAWSPSVTVQRLARAAPARAAPRHRPPSARRPRRCRPRRDPRCRPGRTRCRPRGAGETPRRDRHSGAACRRGWRYDRGRRGW